MGDQNLFLVDGFDDVALRLEGDVIIPSEVLADSANRGHLAHDVPDIDMLAGYGLDDLVVVILEIPYVLVGNAVLDIIVMVF